jgi:hypothetical protein
VTSCIIVSIINEYINYYSYVGICKGMCDNKIFYCHCTIDVCSMLLPITLYGVAYTSHCTAGSLSTGCLSLLSRHASLESTYSLQKNMALA